MIQYWACDIRIKIISIVSLNIFIYFHFRKHIEVHGRPTPAVFRSEPEAGGQSSYELTWTVDSYSPIIEYRLLYRQIQPYHKVWNSLTFFLKHMTWDVAWKYALYSVNALVCSNSIYLKTQFLLIVLHSNVFTLDTHVNLKLFSEHQNISEGLAKFRSKSTSLQNWKSFLGSIRYTLHHFRTRYLSFVLNRHVWLVCCLSSSNIFLFVLLWEKSAISKSIN